MEFSVTAAGQLLEAHADASGPRAPTVGISTGGCVHGSAMVYVRTTLSAACMHEVVPALCSRTLFR